MQLPESDLGLDVSLLGEQLVVLDQVIVQDPTAERTVPATLRLVLRGLEALELFQLHSLVEVQIPKEKRPKT